MAETSVVALACPIVVIDRPVYVLNMSVTGERDAVAVVDRLKDQVRALARRLQAAISAL